MGELRSSLDTKSDAAMQLSCSTNHTEFDIRPGDSDFLQVVKALGVNPLGLTYIHILCIRQGVDDESCNEKFLKPGADSRQDQLDWLEWGELPNRSE